MTCDRGEVDFEIVAIIAAIVLCLFLFWEAFKYQDREWQKYSAAHHCQVKGTKAGEMEPVIGGKGGFTWTSDQTIYVCDGGEIVIR